MRRALCILLVGLVGCSGVVNFRTTTFRTSDTLFTVSGFVSSIQLTTVTANGFFVDVTIVTFLHDATSSTVTFCGDLVDEFFLDAFTEVDFFSGSPCAEIVDVVID
jgi:hypothetical protein